MTALPLSEPMAPAVRGFALFEAGFRVFFIVAPLYAACALVHWIMIYLGVIEPPAMASPMLWHAHEMIYGFAAAGVAGFFLTAVPNWTGAPFVRGLPLALLASVWLLGRIAMNAGPAVPPVVAAALDLAFLPILAVLVAPPLLRNGIGRNAVLLVVLVALWGGDLAMQAELTGPSLGIDAESGARGARVAIDILALLITVIGGRIVPAFTTSFLKLRGERRLPRSSSLLDRLAIGSMVLVLVAEVVSGGGPVTGAIALAAALIQAVRLAGWRGLATARAPILFVLHLGYAWLVIGLALKGAAAFIDALPETAALHALTVGAVGTMMTAVMSRAALGHTGRKLVAHPVTVAAYALVSLAALLRVVAGVAPGIAVLVIAGIAWSLAFALFLAVYAPILVRPRVDGQPG
ncbi:MAG TPA: NnrS family protein [Stellaceae bacterium]|nr:NnrS family protein [Stellaceae bacterium]